MSQTISWIVGGPRAGTNLIARILEKSGHFHGGIAPPGNAWNPSFGMDGELEGLASCLLGCHPTVGLQIPVRPTTIDPEFLARFQAVVARQAALVAPAPYLLCGAWLPALSAEILATLPPASYTHKLFVLSRPLASRKASLVARSGASLADCTAHIAACDAARDTLAASFPGTVTTVDFPTIIGKVSDRPGLSAHLQTLLGFAPTPASLDLIQADAVRF